MSVEEECWTIKDLTEEVDEVNTVGGGVNNARCGTDRYACSAAVVLMLVAPNQTVVYFRDIRSENGYTQKGEWWREFRWLEFVIKHSFALFGVSPPLRLDHSSALSQPCGFREVELMR
jgi:hypothetical protein